MVEKHIPIKRILLSVWNVVQIPVKIISIAWVVLTLSFIHVIKFQDEVLTSEMSNQEFFNLRKDMFGDQGMHDVEFKSDKDEARFDQKFDKIRNQYLCQENSGIAFTYTCKNKIVEFIVDYFPIMLTSLILGLLSFSPIFLIGAAMLIPYVITVYVVKDFFNVSLNEGEKK